MTILVTIIHVFVCVFLILVILLQQGRGGGMGAAFGGASQQVFGGAGAGNFLTKLTEVCAFTFMFTSLLLAGLASQRGPSKYEEAAKVVYAGQVAVPSASAPPIVPPIVPQPTPLEMPLPIAPGTSAPSGGASSEPLVPAPGSAAPSAAPILPLIPAPSASH
ncbi:MAG: preprotein translocase subunit SecG [Myxococcales bacterium]|nr:preprotein translocase subunit SecG [Myxococcales bacterium]